MAIRVSCPSCKSDVHVDENLAGKDILCPSCKERLTVPSIAAGQPEAMPGDSDVEDDRYREGAAPRGGLPRWGEDEDYETPLQRDTGRWNATVTGLNLIFWTSLVCIVLFVLMQGIALAMGNNPQMLGVNPGGPPPPQAMAFGLGMMVLGCAMIVLGIVWFVGMCLCCTVPAESGAKGRAITTVVLIGVTFVGGIIFFIAMFVFMVGQVQKMGAPPPPGQFPFPLPALLTVAALAALDGAVMTTLWLLFHKAIADFFRNNRLSKHCVWFIIFYLGTSVVTWILNLVANPMFHGGDLLQGPTPLLMVAQLWGILLMIALSVWYLYINRETQRTILGEQTGVEVSD